MILKISSLQNQVGVTFILSLTFSRRGLKFTWQIHKICNLSPPSINQLPGERQTNEGGGCEQVKFMYHIWDYFPRVFPIQKWQTRRCRTTQTKSSTLITGRISFRKIFQFNSRVFHPLDCVTSISYWNSFKNAKHETCLSSSSSFCIYEYQIMLLFGFQFNDFKYFLFHFSDDDIQMFSLSLAFFANILSTKESTTEWKQKHIFHPFFISNIFFYCSILQILPLNGGSLIFMNYFL